MIKSMPKKIKDKIILLQKLAMKTKMVQREIDFLFKEYDLDPNIFYGIADEYCDQNDAMAYVINAEGSAEDNISLIEELFVKTLNERSKINE